MKKIVIIGGGAAGMMAAVLMSRDGNQVTLIEQNEKLGKKLFITGKGRCNFTNACTENEFLDAVVDNPRFLYSALSELNPEALIRLFESWGLKTKVERGRRAFPSSDRSYDVIDMFKRQLKEAGTEVLLNCQAAGIRVEDGAAVGVMVRKAGKAPLDSVNGVHRFDGERFSGAREFFIPAEAVVVAAGGLSYRSTGSTGDGLRFARELGIKVTETYPSLVPIVCKEESLRALQGLSLRNVELIVRSGKKELFRERGEMLFTHFGVSGPLVLSASARLGPMIGRKPLTAAIDLKPALTDEQMDRKLVAFFQENPNRTAANALAPMLPSRMLPAVLKAAGLEPDRKANGVTRTEREAILAAIKRFPLTFTALRGYEEAVVTKGGVSVREIDPKTFEAKKVRGLHFIGEVLDLDALTGGYNLQIAWSTAASCAKNIGRSRE
ncbi:MAG: NAD(P)/FAD-dependent oxidoreductase [Lachnospiraceae bacterium]|nr:NAD(P)/FAD-dependent oxidoreductase [Lachnospiraceae bacterium]